MSKLKQFVLAIAIAWFTPAIAAAGLLEDAAEARGRRDYATMLNILRKAAEEGNSQAQFEIGLAYELGRWGVPEDLAEAAKWYGLAAERGYASAQVHLGNFYRLARGVTQDFGKAVALFRSAAEQQDPYGEFFLGEMYLSGQGVEQSHSQAMDWHRRAATKTSKSPLNHVHHSTTFGWTIWYPARWTLEAQKQEKSEIVRITDLPPGSGVVHVNVVVREIKDPGDFLKQWAARRTVSGWRLIERKQQQLSDGTTAEIFFDEQTSPEGGRSLIALVVRSDRLIWVTAETLKSLWPEYETTFLRILNSFSLR